MCIFRGPKIAVPLFPEQIKLQEEEPYLSFGPFGLCPDLFCSGVLGWRAPACRSGQGRRYQLGRGFRWPLRLEEVDAEAQAPVGREISVPQLRHAPGELLHARLQVGEDGEVHLSLQAGRGADGDAGALPFDAQVGLLQVQQVVVLIILRDGAEAFFPRFPLWRETFSLTCLAN